MFGVQAGLNPFNIYVKAHWLSEIIINEEVTQMVRKVKNLVVVLVLLCMVFSIFSGCQEKVKEDNQTTVTETTPEASKEEIKDINSLPKPTLKYFTISGVLKNEPGTGPAYEAIVEKTGYKLDISSAAKELFETKLNMIMASSEEYDMIRLPTSASYAYFSNYVKNGAVASLDESIEKYGPELKKRFKDTEWNDMKLGTDNIFALPSTSMPRLWHGLAIRTDWLEKLNLPYPKTIDDFYNVLKEFKEKDPGGLGKDKVIPFSTELLNVSFRNPLIGSFGFTYEWIEKDGKIINMVEFPGFKEYVLFMKKLFDEDLMDKDVFVNKDNTVMEKVNKGLVGIARYAWNHLYQTRDLFAKEKPDWKMDFIPNLVGKNGEQGMQTESGIVPMTFVPKISKNADHVINYAEQFIKNDEFLNIGEEGKHWKKEGENRSPILPTFDEEKGDMFFYGIMQYGETAYPMWLVRVFKVPSMGKAYTELMQMAKPYIKIPAVPSTLNMPTVNEKSSSLNKYVSDEVLKFIVGENEMSKWDEFVNKWKADGGDAMTAEVNKVMKK
jgi:putative aldouronate transport system substrate-binding protein